MKIDDKNARAWVSIQLLLFGLSVYLAWVSARHWWNAERYLESFEYIGGWDYNIYALVWRKDIWGHIIRDWLFPQWRILFAVSVSTPIVIGLVLIGSARCKACLKISIGFTAPLLFSFLMANAMVRLLFGHVATMDAGDSLFRPMGKNVNSLMKATHESTYWHGRYERRDEWLRAFETVLMLDPDPNVKDIWGITPLHIAAWSDQDRTFFELIFEDEDGWRDRALEEFVSRKMKVVRLLLERGADPNARSRYGALPSHQFLAWGWHEVAELLRQHGAEVSLIDAAITNDVALVRRLLRASPECIREKDSNVAVHWAAGRGNEEVLRFLIAEGADVDAPWWNGDSPLWRALINNNSKSALLLLELGAKVHGTAELNLVLDFCKAHAWEAEPHGPHVDASPELVRAIVERGTGTPGKDKNGIPLLLLALRLPQSDSKEECVGLLKAFLDKGADPNICDPVYGWTALHTVLRTTNPGRWDIELVEMLLKRGVDVNITDKEGWTAFDQAVMFRYPRDGKEAANDKETIENMVKLLEKYGGKRASELHPRRKRERYIAEK